MLHHEIRDAQYIYGMFIRLFKFVSFMCTREFVLTIKQWQLFYASN